MALGPVSVPIFHIHPALRCNLSCAHCYSDSSPAAATALDQKTAIDAIIQAADWGYEVLSISGGEPLLVPWLDDMITIAKEAGMGVSVVTNGLLVQRPGALETLRKADSVAISVDGLAPTHDQMRGMERAYEKVLAAMRFLRSEDIPFAVSCGVTKSNLDDVETLAAEMCCAGAALLQLHPVEYAGRASQLSASLLDQEDLRILFVATAILAGAYAGQMNVATDIVHRAWVEEDPGILYAPADAQTHTDKIADMIGILVLDAHGFLRPICHGFSAEFSLGNVRTELMTQLGERFIASGFERLLELGALTLERVRQDPTIEFFNPSELLARVSASKSAVAIKKSPSIFDRAG